MKSYFLLVCFLLSTLTLPAQHLLKLAEEEINEQSYPSAIANLDLVIQNRKEYADKDLAKAYYLRGLAFFKITTKPSLLKTQPSAFSKCYHDFKMVKQLDHKESWKTAIDQHLSALKPVVTQNSIKLLQNLYGQTLSLQQRKEEANLAKGFIEILIDMNPDNYINYDLRGQVKLAVNDSLAAMVDFQNSIKLYQKTPPVVPDFFMAYAYYRSALIQRAVLQYDDQALSTLQSGIRFLKMERKRIGTITTKQQTEYQKALNDLQNFELDLYYQQPQISPKALQKFENALKTDPNNYATRCAYAALLELSMPQKAIAQYQEAIKINPGKKQAHYNIGVLYINQSIQFLKEDLGEGDLVDKEIQANQIAKKALPYLEEAFKIDPKDKTLLQTIINLSMKVNDLVKYQHYKDLRELDKMK